VMEWRVSIVSSLIFFDVIWRRDSLSVEEEATSKLNHQLLHHLDIIGVGVTDHWVDEAGWK
jgi:hypothetical protein